MRASTVTERSPGGTDIGPGEEICHLVEAHDPDTALCGKDVSGYPWNPPWPYCVVCVDLARNLGWEMSFLVTRRPG